MVSVSSDIASTLALQSARAKAARDDASSVSDHFGSLVEQTSSTTDTAPAPAARPDIPAPARRDDRPVADRPKAADRPDDRAARPSQDRRTDAATDKPQTGKTARKDDKSAKSDQPTDSKVDSANGHKDATSDDASADGTDADATTQKVAVEMVPVAALVSSGSATDPTASTETPEAGSSSQPLAIAAAAAMKAKLDAGEVAAPEISALPSDAPADAEANFAAMIAGATPAAAKGAKKTEGGETAKTAGATTSTSDATAESKADISALTTPTTGATTPKHVADGKTDQPTTEASKPDAAAVNADAAQPASEQHRAHRTEQAPPAASLDQAAPTNAPLPQPTHLQATNNVAVAQQLAPQVAANPPVPLSGVAVEIAQSAKAGKTSFDIRLDPAELGRIDVRLEVDKHGNVTSHLTVEKPETLTMLRQDAPQLQRALEQAGLKTNDGGLQFSLRDQSPQQQQQQNGDQSGRHMHRLTVHDDDTVTVAPAARGYGRMYGANGGVDISI
ncbi:MAG: flagellar hook-length control protein [Bradyrhizobiaceae bacterium PARB1]|nr:MAG: flagellar hook-length control protein [Bradyrhizobiaceae bacterium PARB1]